MNKWFAATAGILLLFAAAAPLEAMICGSRAVKTGDFKFEILDKCGDPDMSETIGYTVNRRGDREFKIEQWVYGPWRGIYYILMFEGSRLKSIETRIKRP
jgi:hypothetical protein